MHDDAGRLRLVIQPWEVADLVWLAFEEPVQFADGQPAVFRRLATLLREFAWRARGRGVDDLVRNYADRVADRAVCTTGVPAEEGRVWREQAFRHERRVRR